ncbi:EF-hand domain-containing protein [Roseivivax jejudonensis]|nr:EF-hand domain-containing protein [Roseivivax jejudonensis]
MTRLIGAAALVAATALVAGAADARDRGGDRAGWHHGAHGAGSARGGFGRLDVDGDGEVSLEEFENPAAARFAAMDADGDGAVTAEEMVAYAEAQETRRREARAQRMLARLDADDSGSISLDEMENRPNRGALFERLDSDDSGGLTREEMRAARELLRERARGGDD